MDSIRIGQVPIVTVKYFFDNIDETPITSPRNLSTELCTIILTLPAPISGQREKINLNFYFHTALWCLKRFYDGL